MQAITACRSCSCARSRKSSLPLACSCSQSRVASLIVRSMQPSRESGDAVLRKIIKLVQYAHHAAPLARETLLDAREVRVVVVEDEQRRAGNAAAKVTELHRNRIRRVIAVQMQDADRALVLQEIGRDERLAA